jgi:hypothetical protein
MMNMNVMMVYHLLIIIYSIFILQNPIHMHHLNNDYHHIHQILTFLFNMNHMQIQIFLMGINLLVLFFSNVNFLNSINKNHLTIIIHHIHQIYTYFLYILLHHYFLLHLVFNHLLLIFTINYY